MKVEELAAPINLMIQDTIATLDDADAIDLLQWLIDECHGRIEELECEDDDEDEEDDPDDDTVGDDDSIDADDDEVDDDLQDA